MQNQSPQISTLHRRYCELIGDRAFTLSLGRIFAWDHWLSYPRKFTEADLTLVVEHLKRRAKERKWSHHIYSFRNLIEQPEKFEEWLVEARAEKRNIPLPPSVKDKWVPKPVDTAKPVSAFVTDISALVKAAREAVEKGT